ncbi:MAG: hypothetical protein R2747_05590 [Pyrinomonadaceae bacterium]
MIIKGYLTEISFIELLRIISKYDGRLGIWNFDDRKQIESFFLNKQVVYFNVNKRNIVDLEEIKSFVNELCLDKKSYYAFQTNAVAPDFKETITTVEQLINFSLSQGNENEIPEIHLPNLQTKFETVNKVSTVIEGELEGFWNKTVDLLHNGCSGEDILNQFDFSEKEVQESLYKLRTKGLIKTFRAFKFNKPIGVQSPFANSLQRLSSKAKAFSETPTPTEGQHNVRENQQNFFQNHETAKNNGNQNSNQNTFLNEMPPPPTILVPEENQKIESPQVFQTPPAQSPVSNHNEPSLENEPPLYLEIESKDIVEIIEEQIDDQDILEYQGTIDENPVKSLADEVNQPNVETEEFRGNPSISREKPNSLNELNNPSGKTGLVRRMLNSLFR